MKRFIAVLMVFAAAPCFAMKQDIVMIPEGFVDVRPGQAAPWTSVDGNLKLAVGAEIRTGADSKAGVLFPDGSRFLIGNNSLFSVEDTSKQRAGFRLKLGKLRAAVAGYFASRFEVRTPSAVCAVRGTAFDIEVGADGNTEMSVAEGLVEVNDPKGNLAVVSSDERIHVGMDGMSAPEGIPLGDERAGQAARPMAVLQDSARERTRTMLEELRNRELKANESQLGKDSVDAFGRRVRLEEYLLRPSDNAFKLLFLTQRPAENRLDWGHIMETFNSKIPDDISEVGKIRDGMYFSETMPSNWMTNFEIYLTNTVDSVKETMDFARPVQINFSGYDLGTRYFPGSIDYKQTLSGPGVPGGGRVQFQQTQEWNTATAPGEFLWTLKVVDQGGALNTLEQLTLDPANSVDVKGDGYSSVLVYRVGDTYIDANTTSSRPSGPGMADYMESTVYADGSTFSSRKLLASNEGNILGSPAGSGTLLKDGDYNVEMIMGSSLFEGRNIDVILAPEIILQKSEAASQTNGFPAP